MVFPVRNVQSTMRASETELLTLGEELHNWGMTSECVQSWRRSGWGVQGAEVEEEWQGLPGQLEEHGGGRRHCKQRERVSQRSYLSLIFLLCKLGVARVPAYHMGLL